MRRMHRSSAWGLLGLLLGAALCAAVHRWTSREVPEGRAIEVDVPGMLAAHAEARREALRMLEEMGR